MSRSLKKGPFVQMPPLWRITAMNEAGKKDVVKTWSLARPPSSPRWLVTPSPSTTVASMFRCTSPSPWLVISWASSHRLVRSVVTRPSRGFYVNGN